jgi:glucuronokinase
MKMAEGTAPARTALAGNPSDGYGGAIVTVTLQGLGAHADARPAERMRISPPVRLVDATIARFARANGLALDPVEVDWSTSIPEGVGLGGSSAIIIAVARAMAALHGVELEPRALAALALAVEREDLGIAGGRQDQLVEAFGGLVFIDFAADVAGRVEELDPALLPPLVIAWREDTSKDSGPVHADLRARWEAGGSAVRGAMHALAALAADGRDALLARDREAFGRCVDQSFDLRASIMPLDPRHVEMIECARAAGASANYSGSGGAIAAVCRDAAHAPVVADALRGLGCGVLAAQDPPAARRTPTP